MDDKFHTLGVPQVGPPEEDLGRYDVPQAKHEKGTFKIPTLRSGSETAPSMHDGPFKTLEEVIDFLAQGGGPNSHLSPLMTPWGLTTDENTDLLAF